MRRITHRKTVRRKRNDREKPQSTTKRKVRYWWLLSLTRARGESTGALSLRIRNVPWGTVVMLCFVTVVMMAEELCFSLSFWSSVLEFLKAYDLGENTSFTLHLGAARLLLRLEKMKFYSPDPWKQNLEEDVAKRVTDGGVGAFFSTWYCCRSKQSLNLCSILVYGKFTTIVLLQTQ